MNDWIFAYWKTSFAQSPAPLIILAPGKTGYELASKLMKTRPPSKHAQEQILHTWSTSCQISAPGQTFSLEPSVWRDMLDLIYSGNSDVAFSLLDKFWVDEKYATNLEAEKTGSVIINTSKDAFIKLFLEQLRLSSYIAGIKKLNPTDSHIRNLHN